MKTDAEKSKLELELDKTGLNYVQKVRLINASKVQAEKSELNNKIGNPIDFWEMQNFIVVKIKNSPSANELDKHPYIYGTWFKKYGMMEQQHILKTTTILILLMNKF